MENKKTYKINNSTVTIQFGDLLTSEADAVVISGSVGLPMIGGLPEKVRKKAGESVGRDASKHPGSKLGDVVVTSAGSLRNKYLFQAVTVSEYTEVLPDMSRESVTHAYEYVITHVLSKSLRLLSAMELNSIAFPCLGLGMANMPLEGVARLTAMAISDFLVRTNKSISVELYIYDTYDVYDKFDYLPFLNGLQPTATKRKKPR